MSHVTISSNINRYYQMIPKLQRIILLMLNILPVCGRMDIENTIACHVLMLQWIMVTVW